MVGRLNNLIHLGKIPSKVPLVLMFTRKFIQPCTPPITPERLPLLPATKLLLAPVGGRARSPKSAMKLLSGSIVNPGLFFDLAGRR